MAVTERPAMSSSAVDQGLLTSRGFRPGSRRRMRIALGVALVAVAIGGNVLVYSSLDDRIAVLQVVRDVPAGAQLTADDLRSVEVDVDATVRVVDAADLPTVVGQYAKVRLVSGSLVVTEALQGAPLVAPGAAVVAVQVPEGSLPAGLRERSAVRLVLPSDADAGAAPVVVEGRVVGLPTSPATATGTLSVSIEVPVDDATLVVASDDVGVVLLEPGTVPEEDGS